MILFPTSRVRYKMDMFDGRTVLPSQATDNVVRLESYRWMRQYEQDNERNVIDATEFSREEIHHSLRCTRCITNLSHECTCRKDSGTPPLRLV